MGGCTLTASLAHKARTTPTARPFQLSHLLSAAHLFQFAAIHARTWKSSFQMGILPPLTEGREQEGGNIKKRESRRVDCLWLFSSLLPRMRQRIKRQTSKQIPSSRETFGWWCCEPGKNPGGRNGIGRSGAGSRALTAAAALRRSLQQRACERRTTHSQPPMFPLGLWGPSALQAFVEWNPAASPETLLPPPLRSPYLRGHCSHGGGGGIEFYVCCGQRFCCSTCTDRIPGILAEPTASSPGARVQAGCINQPGVLGRTHLPSWPWSSAVPVGRQAQVAFSDQTSDQVCGEQLPLGARDSWALPGCLPGCHGTTGLPNNGKASSTPPATDRSCHPRTGTVRQARKRERAGQARDLYVSSPSLFVPHPWKPEAPHEVILETQKTYCTAEVEEIKQRRVQLPARPVLFPQN